MDMTQLRQQIDQVDRQLLELFAQRMEISGQIADYKKEHDLPILDARREQEKLRAVADQVSPDLESHARVLYSLLFELSRSYQSTQNAAQTPLFRQIIAAMETTSKCLPGQATVACLGQQEDVTERCVQRLFSNGETLYFSSREAVFHAIRQGMCAYGLLPLEDGTLFEDIGVQGYHIVRAIRAQSDGIHRFLLISPKLEIYPGADRTTLRLVLPNSPGSLYRVLARLYTLGLNIARLDSRAIAQDDLKMGFCLDVETSVYCEEFARLMCELDELCLHFQYLGSYTEVL